MWSALLEFNTPPRTWAQNRIRGRCAIGLLLLLLRWSLSFFFCSSYRTHIIIEYSRPAVCVYIYKVDDDEDGAAEMRGKNMFWYRDYYKTEEKRWMTCAWPWNRVQLSFALALLDLATLWTMLAFNFLLSINFFFWSWAFFSRLIFSSTHLEVSFTLQCVALLPVSLFFFSSFFHTQCSPV